MRRYLEREAEGRQLDGLDIAHNLPSSRVRNFVDEDEFHHISESESDDSATEWEAILGLGKKRRESVVNWLLDVPILHFYRLSSLTFHSRQVLPVSPVFSDSTVTSPTPSVSSSSSVSCSQQSSTTSTADSSIVAPKLIYNLLDQLQSSPETRFHALWMFLRFFYLTMSPASEHYSTVKIADPVLSPIIRTVLAKDGLDLYLWDIAVACLSLSVKVALYHVFSP